MLQAIVQETCTKDAYRVPPPCWGNGKPADFACIGYGEHAARKGNRNQVSHQGEPVWYVILYEAGQGKVWVGPDKKLCVLRAGDVIVLRAGGFYQREEFSDKESLSRYRWVMLVGTRVSEVLESLDMPPDQVMYRPSLTRKLEPLFDDMRSIFDKSTAPMVTVCELGWRFARALYRSPTQSTMVVGGANVSDARATAAVEWLRCHYTKGYTVGDLIKAMHLSPATLNRLFHRHTGQSPKMYLDHLRLTHAKRLLTLGGYTSKEIATRCGYRDHRHFGQAFTRAHGMPPQAWGKESGGASLPLGDEKGMTLARP